MVKTKQYHHSSNSDLEDSTVTPYKNGYYVPVSALCAESTMDKILFKTLLTVKVPNGRSRSGLYFTTVKYLHFETKVVFPCEVYPDRLH